MLLSGGRAYGEDADASTVNLARVPDGEHIAPAHEGRG